MKARSPAPVRMTTRTLRSSLSWVNVSAMSAIMVAETALTGGLS